MRKKEYMRHEEILLSFWVCARKPVCESVLAFVYAGLHICW